MNTLAPLFYSLLFSFFVNHEILQRMRASVRLGRIPFRTPMFLYCCLFRNELLHVICEWMVIGVLEPPRTYEKEAQRHRGRITLPPLFPRIKKPSLVQLVSGC